MRFYQGVKYHGLPGLRTPPCTPVCTGGARITPEMMCKTTCHITLFVQKRTEEEILPESSRIPHKTKKEVLRESGQCHISEIGDSLRKKNLQEEKVHLHEYVNGHINPTL